jgi:uncharacterized protein YdgA (DUF945 family)
MMPLRGLLSLGVWFWLSLPLMGAIFWIGSGWFTEQQLKQNVDLAENLKVKSFESSRSAIRDAKL